MKLFYTGSQKFNQPQTDNIKSLGGMISSSQIDESLSNVFGDITKYGIYNNLNKGEYRCLAVLNNGLTNLSGLKVFFTYPDESDSSADIDLFATFQIGFEQPQVDPCGDILFSKVSSIYSKPNGISFSSVDGLSNGLVLPDLASNQYIGLWIKRIINSNASKQLTDQQYLDILNNKLVLPQVENINLNLVWN